MWWVKTNSDHDFGPEYGIDYARFADPPDLFQDHRLLERINNHLFTHFAEDFPQLEVIVRNGFVILKGQVRDAATKKNIVDEISLVRGVKEVITQISCPVTNDEHHL